MDRGGRGVLFVLFTHAPLRAPPPPTPIPSSPLPAPLVHCWSVDEGSKKVQRACLCKWVDECVSGDVQVQGQGIEKEQGDMPKKGQSIEISSDNFEGAKACTTKKSQVSSELSSSFCFCSNKRGGGEMEDREERGRPRRTHLLPSFCHACTGARGAAAAAASM